MKRYIKLYDGDVIIDGPRTRRVRGDFLILEDGGLSAWNTKEYELHLQLGNRKVKIIRNFKNYRNAFKQR